MPSSNEQRRRIVVDLDGTLCEQTTGGKTGYSNAAPRPGTIRRINELWINGWDVTIFTARGMSTCNDAENARMMYEQLTIEWLKKHRVCYDHLVFGKPPADYYVDDKALSLQDFEDGRFD